MRPDFDWQQWAGRDADGERFSHMVLVHGSGRLLAKIWLPIVADEYAHRVYFYAGDKDLRAAEGVQFADVDSAKRHVEAMLAGYVAEPVAVPSVSVSAPRSRWRRMLDGLYSGLRRKQAVKDERCRARRA